MKAIADALELLAAERDLKLGEISVLNKEVEGLDTALSALRSIDARDGVRLNLAPAVEPVDDAPAGEPVKTMADIVEAVAKPDPSPVPTAFDASMIGAAEKFADLLMADLPRLMKEFEHGPTAKDLQIEYGAPDSRVREACRRLHNSNRALFSASQITGLLHLTPRAEKVAA